MNSLTIKETVKGVAKRLAGALPVAWERSLRRAWYGGRAIEPEIRWLSRWCPPDKIAIDVGANRGDYALYLCRLAREVWCFEPNPGLARELRRLLAGQPVRVENTGLGSAEGELILQIPCVEGKEIHGWASVDRDFTGESWQGRPIRHVRREPIRIRTLDSYGFQEVGFIKIDVEGHEFEVLRGAEALLRAQRPNLLVEIEQRHHGGRSIHEIFDWLADLGYAGHFLRDGKLRPLAEFDVATDQARPDEDGYLFNFYFTAEEI
ncbi:MAG: FkbM family methyltransferase [Verrucomicrobiae bacterium]|nr:FkbM family methyltransferase [Verrucomicrobiae bacterium]